MSTIPTPSDSYNEYERVYAAEMLERDFYGAFLTAIRYRATTSNLSQAEIARRSGKRREQISRMVSGPCNHELATIAVVANALDLDFRYVFVDRASGRFAFNGRGMHVLESADALNHVLMPNYARQWSVTDGQVRRFFIDEQAEPISQIEAIRPTQQNRVGVSVTSQVGS